MADEISKKVLIEIDVALNDAKAAVNSFKGDLDSLKSSTNASKNAINDAKAAQAQYAAELAKGRVEQQAVRKAIDEERLARLKANAAAKASKEAYVAAAGSYDEAQKKLTALGRAIKASEGGFDSTNPKIKAQVQEYRKLNDQLKRFDEQLGNHQRKVGQYENALSGLSDKIGRLIPGYDQFSGVIQGAAKSFNIMKGSSKAAGEGLAEAGEGSEAAAAGMGEAGAASGGLAIAVLAIVAAVATLIKYFADLTPNADALAQRWEYLKGLFRGFADDIGKGVGFGQLADDMKRTAQEAANLKLAMQDLNRAQAQDLVDDAKADAQIAELQLKMKNRRNTVAQEKAYFDQIQKIAQDKHDGNKKLADEEYQLAVRKATNSNRFTKQEIDDLKRLGVEYAIILDKQKGLVNGEDDIKAIVAAQQKQIGTDRELQMIEERKQNRLDAVEMRAEQKAQKEEQQLDEMKRAYDESVNERVASITRMISFEYEAFAKELSSTDEHYRQMIFKQEEFVKKQEAILHSKKATPKEKAQAKLNIGAGNAAIKQFQVEQNAELEKLTVEHNHRMIAEYEKSVLDLKTLQIANIQNNEKREVAAAENSQAIKSQQYDEELHLLQQNIRALNGELEADSKKKAGDKTKLSENELQALKTTLNEQNAILAQDAEKRTALEKETQLKIAKIRRDAANQRKIAQDEADVINNKRGDNGPSRKELDAQIKLSNDKFDIAIEEAKREGLSTVELEAQKNEAKKQLTRQYYKEVYEEAMQWEQLIQNTSFALLKQSLDSRAQAAQVSLERSKTWELQNTALTSTQKYEIEEKYRIKQGQEKVKEFKANQKLSEAQAVINGMVAIGKTFAELGWPAGIVGSAFILAQTAFQVATIASQKPPAYAQGGLHYTSDGRGGVLPGYSKKDNTNAFLRSGEGIVVSEAMQNPAARSIVSAINVGFGGRPFDSAVNVGQRPAFASGGVFNTYLPVGDNGLRPSLGGSRIHSGDLQTMVGGIVDGVSGAIANMPPPIVDVKDIAYEQGKLTTVQDRATY